MQYAIKGKITFNEQSLRQRQ